jgi:hypothetical protein
MHKIIITGAIALTIFGAATLVSRRADAGPAADWSLRAAIENLHPVDTVACHRSDRRDGHRCGHVVPRTDNPAVRLDESGLPDSRRRFSRW